VLAAVTDYFIDNTGFIAASLALLLLLLLLLLRG